MAPVTFVIPGQPSADATRGAAAAAAPPSTGRGTVKQSVRVAARRGEGSEVTVTATPGRDVVVLHIENGPSLTLHPENARDLIVAQSGSTNRGAGSESASAGSERTSAGSERTRPTEIHVPTQLRWRGLEQTQTAADATRSRFGDVLLNTFEVVTDAASDFASDFLAGKAQSFAASKLVGLVDAQVDEGVYQLDAQELPLLKTSGRKVSGTIDAGPGAALVFVHGTFSSTSGTFSKLWLTHPDFVERLFKHYSNRVFALDHRTLGVSPIANALSLVSRLGKGVHLNVVTHSRGGLVGEVLAHACARGPADLKAFAGDEYRKHREQLQELISTARDKNIQVDRLVRVGCPARGTLLASKRLDAYLSVLKWSLELAGLAVVPALVDFLNGVAQYRADPAKIPGLAAQIPDNPLVRWLHDVKQPIASDLRVIAGDMAGDSIASWLKTLLADAFYWTDNDLVVQTRSMYGGTPRSGESSFALDRGGKVSHFSYFSNAGTAEAVVNALTEAAPVGFRPIGPKSYAGQDASGVRARRGGNGSPRADRPAVIIVPGIFGSHLANGKDRRLWLDWTAVNALERLRFGTQGIRPQGLVEDFYADLSGFLSDTHEVIDFAYDWRQPIRESAALLGQTVAQALDGRRASGQPVRVLAHSSGGLVVRALQLADGAVWNRWLSHDESRFVMLGTPNTGFWAPMQVLSGDDTLGDLLAFVSAPFREQEARQILAEFPGLVELQAGLLDDPLLSRESRWRELADDDVRRVAESSSWHTDHLQRRTVEWGVPRQPLLDAAVDLHKRFDQQRSGALKTAAERISIVSGRSALTPAGYESADGLTYLYSDAGDGYVTFESASLPFARTWLCDCEHSRLPAKQSAFGAYLELLQQGRTNMLTSPTTRGGRDADRVPRAVVRRRPARTPKAVVPPATNDELLGAATSREEGVDDSKTLRVTVVNGDLSFVGQPLLLGHYRSSRLTGAEAVMNTLIGGAMTVSLEKGQYPDAPASHKVFINTRVAVDDPRRLPRPEAVIVVGLGEEGKLEPAHLARTVQHGVIAWAQRETEKSNAPKSFELAATLIGSGGIGMSVGQSAQLIVQGVREANDKLAARRSTDDKVWPYVAQLSLIELYLDRATEAWRALQMGPESSDRAYLLTPYVDAGPGALPRPLDWSYRGANYDFIRAESRDAEGGETIGFTLDTKRARSENLVQPVQRELLRSLIAEAADDKSQDLAIRKTLFRLLVPVEMEPFLTGDTEAHFEVDTGTAGVPWELLDAGTSDGTNARPWAIRTKLLRKLRTAEFRAQVADASADANVLIIGDPESDPKLYPPLPGASDEARAVGSALVKPNRLPKDKVVVLASTDSTKRNGPNARTVINALMERDWRIVHIAGHGEPPEETKPANPDGAPVRPPNPRGVVLSNNIFLGPREINSMRTIPELVFVNCCYLAKTDAKQLLTDDWTECAARRCRNRPRFASGVAEALIKAGVRCVIAAGWAVEDQQATIFAQRLYECLLDNQRFADAVASAREAAWRRGGNTWAAYQCYGDPDWTFRRATGDAQRPTVYVPASVAPIASARELVLALQTIAVQSEFQKKPKQTQRERIAELEKTYSGRWGRFGRVAEAFAVACAKAGDDEAAIDWYTKALQADDGGASIKAVEQRANLEIRRAWNAVSSANAEYRKLLNQHDGAAKADRGAKTKASQKLRDAKSALDEAIAGAKPVISSGIEQLRRLVALEISMERGSLLGSAYKRLALIAAIVEDADAEISAIEEMKRYYEQAETFGRDNKLPGFYYPALNRLAADFALDSTKVQLEAAVVDAIRADLEAIVRERPDFWNVVSQTELRVYESLARRALSSELQRIVDAYDDLHLRVSQEWMWSSVYDQAEFVLPKYGNRSSAEEKEAADRLIDHLRRLSGRS